jgi:hypothetical protein
MRFENQICEAAACLQVVAQASRLCVSENIATGQKLTGETPVPLPPPRG